LVREVLIPNELAQQLEQRKLNEPVTVTDRSIYYQQHYNVAGGKNWSASFSKTSSRVLGWSRGGHGLRHTYAQECMKEIKVEANKAHVMKKKKIREARLRKNKKRRLS
jgi:integrase